AERAAAELEPAGIDRGRIIVLTPGTPAERPTTVPTRETEPPGIGTALGTVTGAAAGAAGGMQLGTVLSTLLVPGLGPVIALGAGQRDRAYDDVVNKLKQRYPDVYNTDAFRRGYERGQARAAGRRSDRAA